MYVNPLIGITNNEKCIRFLSGCNENGRKRTLLEGLALQLAITGHYQGIWVVFRERRVVPSQHEKVIC